jgi:hypothetical protein
MDKTMIFMKRLLWLAGFSVFISCTMHEEYTPPSPIELKPRQTKPPVYDQDIAPDKFGDEGFEPVDIEEEKLEDFDPRAERQMRIQDDIAAAERKKRAGKPTETARKNIKIERKTADQLPVKAHVVKKESPKVEPIEKPAPKQESKKPIVDDLDLDELED